jgi:hypothetical protein
MLLKQRVLAVGAKGAVAYKVSNALAKRSQARRWQMGVGAVSYNVSNALAEEHHTRSAREKERKAEAGGVGSMVESKSRRIVSMRIYLYLGDRANGDCLTASAPNWVSLTVNKQRQLTKALFHAAA